MPEGLTSLYQSLYSSVMYTASVEGPRCVVAFTDGINEPYGSGYDYDYNDVISVANQYKIPIYIIGIGSNVDTNALEYIASSTGGQFYNNRSTADLSDIYSEIYEVQEEMWELSYKSDYPNNQPRKVYLYYDGVSDGAYLRTEFNLEPAVIVDGYSSTGLISNHDLTSFYTDAKYLSTEEIKSLGSIDEIQTVINIYFAKSGYKFGTASVLEQMKELGVIKKNGKKDGNAAENVMKNNEVIYSNFSALQNTRYEWIYSVTSDVFYEYDGDIELDEIEELVNSRLNQSKGRFNYDIEKAYKDLTSWYR